LTALDEEIRNQNVDVVMGHASHEGVWQTVAAHGFRFIGLEEHVMAGLEQEGYSRNIIPAGFLPAIHEPLLTIDLSDNLAGHSRRSRRQHHLYDSQEHRPEQKTH
jgi:hypothetical protein